MKRSFNNLFNQFNDKNNEVLRLEVQLKKTKQEAEQLKKIILNEQKLHVILATVGVIHDKRIYKKLIKTEMIGIFDKTLKDSEQYYLDIQDYIDPVNSFSLDSKLGDDNE